MSRTLPRVAVLARVAALLGACGGYRLVEPVRRPVGTLYSVDPQIAWSVKRDDKVELWTVDGAGLAALYFIDGLADGETIFPQRSRKAREAQANFRAGMTAVEIMEFATDSLAEVGLQRLRASGLRRARFGTLDGFRFEFACLSANGLEMQGLVTGAVAEADATPRLYLVLYLGARAYYFPKYRPVVERILESIEM